ncbi:MAG: hypothetical protein VXZ15_09195 [Planctomycetota bacterium]|nr:hypothetical protein [Planctomycetota bacterium]
MSHVYFDHTQVAMEGYEFAGPNFHYGGAPMKGLKFCMIDAEIL